VLEHIPDDVAAMSELRRVLKSGDHAAPDRRQPGTTYEDRSIKTPAAKREAFWQEDHVRIYGANFADRLRHGGFTQVEKVNMREKLSVEEAHRYSISTRPPCLKGTLRRTSSTCTAAPPTPKKNHRLNS
jgi:hypothetical protein